MQIVAITPEGKEVLSTVRVLAHAESTHGLNPRECARAHETRALLRITTARKHNKAFVPLNAHLLCATILESRLLSLGCTGSLLRYRE